MADLHVVRERFLSSPALLVVAAIFVCATSSPAQQPPPAATRRVQERALSPIAREVRTDVAKLPDAAGRVVLDVRKVAATTAAPNVAIIASDLAGNAIPVDAMGGGNVAVTPRADQWVVVRPASVAPQVMQKGVQWLPGVCLAPAATPDGAKEVFSSYADFATVPVVWDATIDAYRVRGAVGVARDGDLAQSGAIGRTATVKLRFEGVSLAAPLEFAVADLGLGGEQEFSVVFSSTDVPRPSLVVRSSLGSEQPYVLDVRPRVALSPRRNPILGFGLEEIPVTVECVEAFGAPLALGGNSPIDVECSAGSEVDADGLAVSSAAPRAEFRFRSSTLGPARIKATTRTPAGAVVGSIVVQQVLPWAQAAAALVGGALGGYARRFVRGARRRTAGRQIIEGLVVGLVAFVAGVLGVGIIHLPAVIVATVGGAFLTAVIAGFAGVVVLERMTTARTGGGADSGDKP